MIEKATFGMGCFWNAQKVFDKISGVISTRVGYMGGCKAGTYENAEREGHIEVVELTFSSKRDSPDPADKILGPKVTYEKLLKVFFREHDSTSIDKQGNNVGKRYRSVIFYDNDLQERRSKEALASERKRVGHLKGFGPSGLRNKKIVTQILSTGKFYEAEPEHQKYLEKSKL